MERLPQNNGDPKKPDRRVWAEYDFIYIKLQTGNTH